jgi:hypothetical protein
LSIQAPDLNCQPRRGCFTVCNLQWH